MRASPARPPTTPPAIAPAFDLELAFVGVGVAVGGAVTVVVPPGF